MEITPLTKIQRLSGLTIWDGFIDITDASTIRGWIINCLIMLVIIMYSHCNTIMSLKTINIVFE